MPAQQLIHVAEHGLFIRDIRITHVFGKPLLVEFRMEGWVLQKAFDLRPKQEVPILLVVVKRLMPKMSRAPKSFFARLSQITKAYMPRSFCSSSAPYSSYPCSSTSESVEVLNTCPLASKSFAQFLEIVDLAVEHQDLRPVLVQNRLGTASRSMMLNRRNPSAISSST